ncbi:MAG: rhomboid family intramembrane serine protease [Deltaproteobacteria bacterium]|nr:rhomboid family intramembrane serine protease [Deltaproteobacteria bacterium]
MSIPESHTYLPFGTFEKVVELIVAQGGAKLSIQQLSRTGCVFMLKRGLGKVRIIVTRYDPSAKEEKQRALTELIKTCRDAPLDLVVVGGDQSVPEELQSAIPRFTHTKVGFLHITDDLISWKHRLTAVDGLLSPLQELLAAVSSDADSWEQLLEESEDKRAELAENIEEMQAFSVLVQQRKPIATWTIAGVIGVVFALELAFAGAQSTVGLVRMGALVPSRVADGEWWRLISCTFLHAGWMHVVLNTYVLLILGSFLERIIGPARFLLIYAASAVAGSIGSAAFLGQGFSVGASGAVWGLLGAHAILAYRPQGLIPSAMISGARRAAMINLGINIANSFRPQIDMWAHFAGGGAGALLFASGLLTRSLPRLGELEQHQGVDVERDAGLPASRGIWFASVAASLLLVVGLVMALVVGQPWTLRKGGPTSRAELPKLGISLVLPDALARKQKVVQSPKGPELSLGDLLMDPMIINVFTLRLPAKLDAQGVAREMQALKASLQLPAKSKLRGWCSNAPSSSAASGSCASSCCAGQTFPEPRPRDQPSAS